MPLALPEYDSKRHERSGPEQAASRPPDDPWSHLDPDPYGAELARDARVWKVYVGEADKSDAEMIDGWNKSLDVLLVFAALFSAITTSFLSQSSESLKQDPNDVSAAALVVISKALLVVTNQTSLSSTLPETENVSSFVPSQNAVIVNTLWYLSLSLSVATSFLAVLAKDWCRSFGANRTGHPQDQALRRQRKWRMVQRWRLQEVISALPLLIHLSLFLFAIGLCLYLWELNRTAAKPVIGVFGAIFLFYCFSSITAAFSNQSPYATILTKVIRSRLMKAVYRLVIGLILICLAFAALALVVAYIPTALAFWLLFLSVISPLFALFVALEISLVVPWWLFLAADKLGPSYCAKTWQDVLKLPFEQQFKLKALFKGPSRPNFLSKLSVSKPKPVKKPSTTISFSRIWHALQPNELTDKYTTSLALDWLIQYCETPSAVNIALQSIAGASWNVDKRPLMQSQATVQILQRMVSSDASNQEIDSILLYKRALQFLGSDPEHSSISYPVENSDPVATIWYLQLQSEREISRVIEISGRDNHLHFQPSAHNLEAMKIGSAAPSQVIQLLTKTGQSDIVPLKRITRLLSDHISHVDETSLHPAAMQSLANAIGLHVSCLTGFDNKLTAPLIDLCVKSCQFQAAVIRFDWSKETNIWVKSQALLIISALLLGRDGRARLSNSNKPSLEALPHIRIKTIMQALDKVYTSNRLYQLDIVCIGCLEILSNLDQYGLDQLPFDTSIDTLKDECRSWVLRNSYGIGIRSHSPLPDISSEMMLEDREPHVLTAIQDIYNIGVVHSGSFGSITHPPAVVYHFVAAQVCKRISFKQGCNALMSRFGFLRLDKELLQSLKLGSIHFQALASPLLPLLGSWTPKMLRPRMLTTIPEAIHPLNIIFRTYSKTKSDPQARYFSATQLWLLLQLVGDSSTDDQKELSEIIRQARIEWAESLPRDQTEEQLQRELEDYILTHAGVGRDGDMGVYSARILECILQLREEGIRQSRGEDSIQEIRSYLEILEGVPTSIRGLSSFIPGGNVDHVSLQSEHVSIDLPLA